MCGICGIFKNSISQQDVLSLRAMNVAIAHRGPDDSGEYIGADIALAMRRLSIIDLAGSKQPLHNENGAIVLVANGEIYNYIELRQALIQRGHKFATNGDCEVILHLYEEKGVNCLDDLRGMFAFALWDGANLFLARDRMGEKPLYFCRQNGSLIFASELKALSAFTGRVIDTNAVDLFMHYQYIPEPMTLIAEIEKLPRAHYLLASHDSITIQRYWSVGEVEPLSGDPATIVFDKLQETVALTLQSDVPVGIALSAGIDSTTVAALARRDVHAFSVGYPGRPNHDEREYAKRFADSLGLPFHEIELSTDEFLDTLPGLVYAGDDPIADIAMFGYYAVMREARRHGVPVMLSGMGGDELFWGYPWVRQAVAENPTPRKQMVFYELSPDFLLAEETLPRIYSDSVSIPPRFSYTPFYVEDDFSDVPNKVCELIFDTWLVSNCIAQVDRLSMAFSVEARLPLLDYKLVETVLGLRKMQPDHALAPKAWLKGAMQSKLPSWILERPKQGFTPPGEEWIAGAFRRYGHMLLDGYLTQAHIFDGDKVRRLIGDSKYKSIFWRALILELWCRAYL